MGDFPSELLPYKDSIEKSKMEMIEVEISDEIGNVNIDGSKLRGNPCLPKNFDYPSDKNGKPLFFLAQLNLSEIPHLENFPKTGLLQFYVGTDECYGLDFGDGTNNSYKVLYVKDYNLKDIWTDFSKINDSLKDSDSINIAEHERKFTFKKSEEFVTLHDFRFKKYFNMEYYEFLEKFPEDCQDKIINFISKAGHKISGYANFTQEDPRSEDCYGDYVLLFQLDSDCNKIIWGDVGVANFFISKQNLINEDFSSVLYNWDCT